jgi:pimeloyl-ACP methyl ester carboxylesterase
MSLRRCLPLLALALLATSASASVPDSFYTPKSALPKAPGKPIQTTSVKGGNLPAGGKSTVLMYSSKAPDGTIVPVTGIMTVPKGKAPKGGFPVVSWAHGTTGIADSCAPSRSAGDKPASDYVRNFRAEASEWIADGYAVVQTDYAGLGTEGMHPYLIGVSEGRSVIDIVRAAHLVDRRVGKRWVAIGHSQGGHATLWAAALGQKYAPSLRLVGAAPLAPASHIGEQASVIDKIDGNPYGGLPALILAGAMQDAGIDPATALSDKAFALYPQIEQVCLDKLSEDDSWGGLALNEIFRDGYDRQPLLDDISANDPEDLTIKVPLLVAQGKDDHTVIPTLTEQTVADLRGRGTKITYKTYEGIDHNGVVEAARKDTDRFIHKRLG